MKKDLINPKNGMPFFRLFDTPVDINLSKSVIKTKLGKKIPRFLNFLFLKQFIFTGLITKDYIAGIAVADLGYAAKGFFYIYDIKNDNLHEAEALKFPFYKKIIDTNTENQSAYFKSKNIEINFDDTNITARSKDLQINIELKKDNAEPLRICSKTSYNRWFFTKKESSIPSWGNLKINDKIIGFTDKTSRGLTDRSLGYPGREIWWNWASTCSFNEKLNEIGLNMSWGINQTGETENMLWANKKPIKLNQAYFEKNHDSTWTVKTNDNIIDLTFYPLTTKIEKENFIFSASQFIQEIGEFRGYINIENKKIPVQFTGWLEDHYIKW